MSLHDLTGIKNYRRLRIVEEPKLEGQKIAEMNQGDEEIRVSPAMYKLIQSDFDSMANSLKVRILPSRRPPRSKQ